MTPTPTPANMPMPKPRHARTENGYVTESAGFKPAAPKVTPTRTDEVTDSDGIVTRMATTPKAVRVTPRPMPMTDSPKFGPLTVRRMTPAELAAARDHAAAVKASRSPFDRG